MRLLVSIIILFSAFSVYAESLQLLLKISNNAPKEKDKRGEILLKMNASNLPTTILKRQYHRKTGKLLNEKSFSIETLREGAVVEQRSGMDVIVMRMKDFHPKNGGVLELKYLHNGITGDYRTNVLRTVKRGEKWIVLDQENNEVKNLYVESNDYFLIGSVGIEKIHLRQH